MKWLLFTSLFPSDASPDNGLFNHARLNALKQSEQDVLAIVPVDLTPHLRYIIKNLSLVAVEKHWLSRFRIPAATFLDNIRVYHPRWFSPPRPILWKDEYRWLHFFGRRMIDKIIRKERPDVVVCSWLNPFGMYAKYIKQKYQIPIFIIPEGDDLLIYPEKYKGWDVLKNILNTNCDRIVCSSQFIFEIASKKRGLQHLVKIQNGYDQGLFSYHEKSKTLGRVNLLCVGYLDYIKGQDILIKAMTKLDEHFELTIVGDGVLQNQLKDLVQTLELANRVHFVGFQPPAQLLSFYRAADIYCLASRSEGFGISILEAMACGLPVVASDVGGIPEKIIAGKNGFIARKEDINDFVKMINLASTHKWDARWIADDVKEKYSWKKWASSIIAEFDEIQKRII